jgi:serine protease AprX
MEDRQTYNIRIISSNCWGTTGNYSPNDLINLASKSAHDEGMVLVFQPGMMGLTMAKN